MKRQGFRVRLGALALAAAMAGCATMDSAPDVPEEPVPHSNETSLDDALRDFGDLLRAYPVRPPYRDDQAIVLAIAPILNLSGDPSLPVDISQMLVTATALIDFPIASLAPTPLNERQANWNQSFAGSFPAPAPAAPISAPAEQSDLAIRGAITEAEKLWSDEYIREMDLLFEHGKNGRESIDVGGSREKGHEGWTFAVDLSLVKPGGGNLEADSQRIDVVRDGQSESFGVFFKGSGVGARRRGLVAQGKGRALRIAAQKSILVLLGRHFEVPYWRLFPGEVSDQGVISAYRNRLVRGEAPDDFRQLLFAHGVDIDIRSREFSTSEIAAVRQLQERLKRPPGESWVDLAIYLWENVPYQAEHVPLATFRQPRLPETTEAQISRLRPGEQFVVVVNFASGDSSIDETIEGTIDSLVGALAQSSLADKDWWIELRGHADDRRGEASNLKLSKERAERVREYLVRAYSIPSERIVSGGFGSTKPPNKDAKSLEKRGANRRVEIFLAHGRRQTPPRHAETTPSRNTMPAPAPVASGPIPLPEQQPSPRGVPLRVDLSVATLSAIRKIYPDGKFSSSAGTYAVRFSSEESELFVEATFFLERGARDPSVTSVGFRCKQGVEGRVRSAIEEQQGLRDTSGSGNRWSNVEGYNLELDSFGYCLRISPAK